MLYVESSSHDPAFNLALEQYLFDAFEDDIFMLWQNSDAVIVGLHQNTAAEVDRAFLDRMGIPVVRRLSGGGAVFHDPGNVNYTVIRRVADETGLDFASSAQPVIDALAALGVRAIAGGRNDITMDGKKISGIARYLRGGRLMHHGTILFDVDLGKMERALSPPDDKFSSKSIKSVRARVVNLREYLPDMTTAEFFAFLRAHITENQRLKPYELTGADLAAVESIRTARYGSWDWNWGESPEWGVEKRRRINGVGAVSVRLRVDQGVIADIAVTGDYFGSRPASQLCDTLGGARLDEGALLERLDAIPFHEYFDGLSPRELVRLLLD